MSGAYFGACPDCGHRDDIVNVGRDHWGVCNACRTRWHVGSNLFSSWREQDSIGHLQALADIGAYREVEAE